MSDDCVEDTTEAAGGEDSAEKGHNDAARKASGVRGALDRLF